MYLCGNPAEIRMKIRGCLVQQATTLREMLELMLGGNYDAYLMDANLGNEGVVDIASALTVYSLIKERVLCRQARFLAISGRKDVVQRALAEGIPAKEKPVSLEDVLALIE